MEKDNLISVNDFCIYHKLEITFIQVLEEKGLIETTTVEEGQYLYPECLDDLERLIRLHQDLSIHLDDLDIVNNLLKSISHLQLQLKEMEKEFAFFNETRIG